MGDHGSIRVERPFLQSLIQHDHGGGHFSLDLIVRLDFIGAHVNVQVAIEVTDSPRLVSPLLDQPLAKTSVTGGLGRHQQASVVLDLRHQRHRVHPFVSTASRFNSTLATTVQAASCDAVWPAGKGPSGSVANLMAACSS